MDYELAKNMVDSFKKVLQNMTEVVLEEQALKFWEEAQKNDPPG